MGAESRRHGAYTRVNGNNITSEVLLLTLLMVCRHCLSNSEHSAPIPDSNDPLSNLSGKWRPASSLWTPVADGDSNSSAEIRNEAWMALETEADLLTRTIIVAKDGSGAFWSVQEAVSSIPRGNSERILIHVKAGDYWEKVRIRSRQDFITIEGEIDDDNSLLTTISFNSTASDLTENGQWLGTYQSATFAADGDHFIARNIVFKNSAPAAKPGAEGQQAVALRVSGDMSAFYGCRFYSTQDTLYDHRGRHFFEECYVEGSVDFIFGDGRSLFKNCHLNVLDLGGIPGYVTAQGVAAVHDSQFETGFSFVNSIITGQGATYLGRTLSNNSRVVFANTFMENIIVPEGWEDIGTGIGMPKTNQNVFFAEFNCTGPGAAAAERAQWSLQLTHEQAEPFLSISFVDGWTWLENPDAAESLETPEWSQSQETAS